MLNQSAFVFLFPRFSVSNESMGLSSGENLLVVQSKLRTCQFYPLDKVIHSTYNRAQYSILFLQYHDHILNLK